MANASAKRVAAQNEVTVRNLRLGILIANALYFLIRFLLPSARFPPSGRQLVPYLATAIPQVVLFRHLTSVGSPRKDAATGALIAPGEDLAQTGVTEWCFDVLYVTWICLVGSSLLGEWVWWLYLSIPTYAAYKVYTSFLAPMLGFGSPRVPVAASVDASSSSSQTNQTGESLSKKQLKNQKKVDKRNASQQDTRSARR